MILLWMAWSAVMSAAAVWLAFSFWGVSPPCRRTARIRGLTEGYAADLMDAIVAGADSLPVPPCRNLRVAAVAIAAICTSTSGWNRDAVRRLVVGCGLERRILRRIRLSGGLRRAEWLALLGRLPLTASVSEAVAPYIGGNDPYIRMEALVARLVSDPSSALRILGDHPHRLTALEVAEVMAVLRRGVLPLAWEPLLMSASSNLRRVGMALVRQFGIDEAERHLHLIAAEGDTSLSGEAFYTLCVLRRPIGCVPCRLSAFDHAARRSLMRLLAMEGYASSALDGVVDFDEHNYYISRVESYKRMLA